jgi:hypothetical protein
MRHHAIAVFCVVLGMFSLAGLARSDEPSRQPTDPFALNGASNILEEEAFGTVNGKMTVGIPYRNAFAISGLWAPPYVSSNFSLAITLMGQPVATQRYTWHPFHVDRTASIQGIAVESLTMLIPGTRAGLVEVTLKNPGSEPREVPVTVAVGATLDRVGFGGSGDERNWGFGRPQSRTATTPKAADGSLTLLQGDQAIVLCASKGIRWDDSHPTGRGTVALPPTGRAKLFVAFAVGPTSEAKVACERIAADPEKAIAEAQAAYAARVAELYQKLPRLESSNSALERFYNRSLVHFVMNRWDVPEFLLHPYYSTGSVKGGCVCLYLWNFGELWEILPLLDPAASRSHIKQFLVTDITKHFAFEPITGDAFGPWYMVNQEKIIGSIYYYVRNTGDVAFLNDVVNGKTILEHVIANALYGDDLAKPVAMIDYGSSNSHLELRRGLPYNHVMPDLNGRRYENYVMAAQLAEAAGKPAPQLVQRAEELKAVLKRTLWNRQTRWFDFQDDKGKKDTRYTLQMFKLFGSKVLDAEEETGLLDHLQSEKEFLSEFGLHSLAKTDPAYDPADVDNGGPGACTSFPPQIAERLYKAGKPDAAENILKRILWWGDRLPYWGDSIVADKVDYRHDTPLQCTSDGVAGAQCIIFGMFGVRAEPNGDIRIHPQPPAFAPKIAIRGLKLRGHVLDIAVSGGEYEVYDGVNRMRTAVGRSVLVHGNQLLHGEASH